VTDALAALLDVVGLDVRYDREVSSADGDWALDLPPSHGLRWVASSTHTTVWVAWHGGAELVRPGSALLVPASGTGARSGTGTGTGSRSRAGTGAGAGAAVCTGVRVGTARGPLPAPDGAPLDPFHATGVHVGSVRAGPLADEALDLTRPLRTRPVDALSEDVVRALAHVEALTGQRWATAQRDTLARAVVIAVLRDEPPAYLTDNGLLRCIDALFADTGTCGGTGSGPGPGSGSSAARSVADLLRTTVRGSRRTAERRFRATTGCTPDALRRWFLSLGIRRALDDGRDEESVATAFGFARASSMRRALARVTPPRTDRPADPWVLPLPDDDRSRP